jgi:hypothetical protein
MAVLVKNLFAGTLRSTSFGGEVVVGNTTSAPETGETAPAVITGSNPPHAILSNGDAKSRTR